jgi:hypothetical protein
MYSLRIRARSAVIDASNRFGRRSVVETGLPFTGGAIVGLI